MKIYAIAVTAALLPTFAAQHLRGFGSEQQRELAAKPQGIGGGSSNPLWYNFGPYPARTTSFNGVSSTPSCASGCPTNSHAYSFQCSTGNINSVGICSDDNAVRGITAIGCSSGGTLRMSTDGATATNAPATLPTSYGCGTLATTTFSDTVGGGFKGAQSAITSGSDGRVALLVFAGASNGRFSKVFGLDGLVRLLLPTTVVAPTDSQPNVKATVQIPSNYPPAPDGNQMGYCSTSTAKIQGLAFTVTGTGTSADKITGFGLRCT